MAWRKPPTRFLPWAMAQTGSNALQQMPRGIADITYIRIATGFVYLAVILDVFSRRVIGWAISKHSNPAMDIGNDLEREYRKVQLFSEPGGEEKKIARKFIKCSQYVNIKNAQKCPAIPFYTLLFNCECVKFFVFRRFLMVFYSNLWISNPQVGSSILSRHTLINP